ncbi:MAG: GMC family oxidoreductase [Nitrospirae bacterium]|nr:GMC family oxidoreductase [Nitrospirota bacterium]
MNRIIDGRSTDFEREIRCEFAVIGTGAAGSVAARILAAAGKNVLMIEAGPFVTEKGFNQREDEMYGLLYVNHGTQATVDGLIGVAQGRCVGGSTVINGGDLEPTAQPVFEYWRRHHDLEPWNYAEWHAAEQRVMAAIGANRIPDALVTPDARVLLHGASSLGWKGGIFMNNRVGCVGAGACLIGCSYNAKRSALITYVPQALSDGARLLHHAPVESIRPDQAGFEIQIGTPLPVRVHADQIVCAAGAIQTPILLEKSGLGDRSGYAGKHLSLQPQVPVLARFREPVGSFYGIPQIAYVDEFETATEDAGYGGFRLESASPGPGAAAALLPGIGIGHLRDLSQFDHYAACMVLVPDKPAGSVQPGIGSRAAIRYPLSEDVVSRMRMGMKAAARAYFEAGAVEILLPWEDRPRRAADLWAAEAMIASVKFEGGRVHLISAHPQGTTRAARRPDRGVVNEWGEHHQVKGLHVLDAGIFPTTSSSHTMVPIMAAADMLARRMVGT